MRYIKLSVALATAGAGLTCLAPVAHGDTPGTNPGGTSPAPGAGVTADADFTPVLNDPNYYKNIGDKAYDQFVGGTTAVATTTIGDRNISLSVTTTIGGPNTSLGTGTEAWLPYLVDTQEGDDPAGELPKPAGFSSTIRLCITCR